MSEIVLKVDNVSKKFCRTLKNLIKYGSLDITRDFLGIETRTDILRKGEFWAVKDVSFELRKGETLGIIGVNGSGKTTLLKMINGIFMPDSGKITAKGRMGALIAVGVGFHPLLTGRENIYVNGQIIGMSKEEINKKLDAIIDFAEIEESIDAPVKHFSSGMLVRLGFSVAVHSDPDIMLIDEVLAVGDIAFRKKCMDRMEQIRNKTSIVFISHNLPQIERICDKVIFLHKGSIKEIGATEEVVNSYYNFTLNKEISETVSSMNVLESTGYIEDIQIRILDRNRQEKTLFDSGDDFLLNIQFNSREEILNPIVCVTFYNTEGINLAEVINTRLPVNKLDRLKKGQNEFDIIIRNLPFAPGTYVLGFGIKTHNNAKLVIAKGQRFAIATKSSKHITQSLIKLDYEWVNKIY